MLSVAEHTIAVVDVGSNSLHLQIVRGEEVLVVRRSAIRLGEFVGRCIPLPAVHATVEALEQFDEEARRHGAELHVFATAALRDADNRNEVLSLVPFPIRVLSGVEEAAMVYMGASRALGVEGSAVVFDLGGRSTEVIRGEGFRPLECFSLPFGHLTLTPGVPPDFRTVDHLRGRLVGTAGTALTLGNMAAAKRGESPSSRHGLPVSLGELEDLVEALDRSHDPASLPGSDPRRADTLRAGAHGVLTLVRALGAPGFITSEGGLRSGLIEDCRSAC